MLVRTLAPLCFFVLGQDGVVSGREGKKREIKLLVPSDELVDEVEELVLDAGVPAGVLLKPASEFEPSIPEVEGAALEVDAPIREVEGAALESKPPVGEVEGAALEVEPPVREV